MSAAIKFGSRLKELRIHLCQKCAHSQGVRDFIQQHYVTLKSNNPKFPILIRECSGVEAKLWARHELGKETSIPLKDLNASEVLAKIASVAK
ncbi:L51 S25 CI-B8 domain containing protein [Asbolus verrucosus]|uniref:NADH dehydrogenase [ubiquinone] 1 alpha subcomplex subunit 2 n=1 Tax=Asbolus verrucosus TaxID=1661398 RepID=A0A482VM06_ASBVE|nr:L51 S25 CI-B8 domain containing protein [Asbolus verrucosus]